MATFRDEVLRKLDGRRGATIDGTVAELITDAITALHDADLADLRAAGEKLADAAEDFVNHFLDDENHPVHAALAAWRSAPAPGDKAKCERCGDTKWIPGVLGIIDGHICPDCATGGGA
jgi:hypothetical protein